MKVKTMVSTLIFLIVLNIGVLGTIVYLNVADRQPPIARFLNPEPRFEPPFSREFGMGKELTEEQQLKLRGVVRSYRTKIEPLQKNIRELEEQMLPLLINNETSNVDDERNILREISNIRLEISEYALESIQSAKSFLSEDQQPLFIRQIMSAGRGRGPGPRPNSPHPPMLNRSIDNQ